MSFTGRKYRNRRPTPRERVQSRLSRHLKLNRRLQRKRRALPPRSHRKRKFRDANKADLRVVPACSALCSVFVIPRASSASKW